MDVSIQSQINREYSVFINDLKQRLSDLNLTFQSFPLDHICYRANSQKDYDTYFEFFKSKSILYTDKIFHDRHFHTFVLNEPFNYAEVKFYYLEFAEPGGSDDYENGFQHFEFLTNQHLEDVVTKGKIERLIFKSKHGEEYLKWEDKISVKFIDTPQITKALLEDNPTIVVNRTG